MFWQRICIVLVFVLVLLLGIHTLTSINQDIGRHLTTGKIIWETHQVPRTNLFSFTAPDFPFINHHWLGGLVFYLISAALGLKSLIVMKAIVLALAVLLVAAIGYDREYTLPTVWVSLLSFFILVERSDVRPEIFSFLFFAWFLWVLFRKRHTRLIWTLPVIQTLWVNTHIYFFMGIVVLGAVIVQEWLTHRTWHFPGWRRLGVLTLAVALAILINPFGIRGALAPLTIFGNYGYSIMENKSPFFLRNFGYPWFTTAALWCGMAVVGVSFLLNIRNIRQRADWLILSVATAGAALIMIRNFPLFALTMVPATMMNLRDRCLTVRTGMSYVVTAILLVVLGISIVTGQFYALAGSPATFGLIVPDGAQAAVDFVRANQIKGPIFNNFDIGSFLIWKLPEEKVFIDGRPEAYPADFIRNVYIKMQEDPDAWGNYSKAYNIQMIFWNYYDITPWSQTFLERIKTDPEWAAVYRDHGIVIFMRNDSQHRKLIEQYRAL